MGLTLDKNNDAEIFAVVAPGFEDLAVAEMRIKFPDLAAPKDIVQDIVRGGILLKVPQSAVPDLHVRLKIPTSFRERLYEFKCRDFPKLYNKIQSLPWRRHLVGDQFELSVSAESSRLGNEKRIAETVSDGILRYFEKQPPKKPAIPYKHLIYVRMHNDVCTISLELTGAPLFQRGYKDLSAVAPLRENLAAGLYFALAQSIGGVDVLIDPMCGSGTLLLEAQLFNEEWRSRDFAFLHDERWSKVIGGHAVANNNGEQKSAKPPVPGLAPKLIVAFDKSREALASLKHSLETLMQKFEQKQGEWIILEHDLFDVNDLPSKLLNHPIFKAPSKKAAIVNPPYGERIKLPKPASQYFPELFERLVHLKVDGFGLIVPKAAVHYLPKSLKRWQAETPIHFQNGGLDVQFLIYRRKG